MPEQALADGNPEGSSLGRGLQHFAVVGMVQVVDARGLRGRFGSGRGSKVNATVLATGLHYWTSESQHRIAIASTVRILTQREKVAAPSNL